MANIENACLICGAPLVYHQQAEEMICAVCGRRLHSNAACVNGHFICDDCHSQPGIAVIRSYCLSSLQCNPVAIAEALFTNPNIHQHGPEHHVLVGAALLTAYRNCGGTLDLPAALEKMAQRGSQVPGGVCGFFGCCGAAVSSGIYVSIIAQATPLSTGPWSLANEMTSQSLHAIATHGGPRCCKRDSYLALETAADFTAMHFGMQLEMPQQIICHHGGQNHECRGTACLFHPRHSLRLSRPTEEVGTSEYSAGK